MSLYKLAIVGRPNVGKSAIFNKVCKKNISIVHQREGVTRDRLYSKAFFQNKPFTAIDTAGLDFKHQFSLEEEINIQTQIAIEEADILVMVVDATIGVTKLDQVVSKLLLKTNKKVILAINKIDSKKDINKILDFHSLGIKDYIEVSASQNYQIDTLVERAFKDIEFDPSYGQDRVQKTNVSIIGRTNVGKSTLINTLLNDNRVVVSASTSTTRDSIDSDITVNNKIFTLIDTAGIRRKNKEKDVLEKFSHSQSIKSIKRSDVCLLVLDALDFMTSQDKKILKVITSYAKALVIVINKWDKMKSVRQEHFLTGIKQKFPNFPAIIISAKEKLNINKIFPLIEKIQKNRDKKLTTPELNRFIEKALKKNPPTFLLGKRLKIYYLTQVKQSPPKFLFFVNNPKLLTNTYKKYLVNQFRKTFDFSGTPIFFDLKRKPQKKESV